ncbi:TonB-dependent receptor [Porticoccus sp. GXU_MW_L64]
MKIQEFHTGSTLFKKRRLPICTLGFIAGASMLPAVSSAQDAENEPEKKVVAHEEIVVTANKREELLQDVPIAVSAFSELQLEQSDISDLLDVLNHTPSVEATPSQEGGGTFSIRGVSTGIGGPGVDSNVALYWNGAYIARDFVAFQDFIDIERVEILRGPQGTLYGRNATGGAINVILKKPEREFGGSFRVNVGEFDRRGFSVAITGPLTDTISGRLSVSRQVEDSYSINLLNNERLRQVDSEAIAGSLLFEPNDNFSVLWRGDWEEDDGAGVFSQNLISTGVETDPLSNFGAIISDNPYEFRSDFPANEGFLKNWGSSVEVVWDVNEYQVKSITAYREISNRIIFDSDGSELPLTFFENTDRSKSYSQEFQLSSPIGEKSDWILGAFYFAEDASDDSSNGGPFFQPGLFTALNNPVDNTFFSVEFPFSNRSDFFTENETEAYALFGEYRYRFNDNWRINLGARYSSEEKTFISTVRRQFSPIEGENLAIQGQTVEDVCQGLIDNGAFSFFNPTGDLLEECAGPASIFGPGQNLRGFVDFFDQFDVSATRPLETAQFNAFTPRAIVEYTPTSDILVYGSIAKGFKSGGFNSFDIDVVISDSNGDGIVDASDVGLTPFQPPFDEEDLLSYELGIKSTLNNGSTVNLTAFFYDYSDIQLQVTDAVERRTFVTSDTEAEIYGLEVDSRFLFGDSTVLDYAAAWIESEYTDFGTPIADSVTGELEDFTGFEIPGNAKYKHTLGLQSTFNLGNNGSSGQLTLRGEWQHRGDSVFGLTTQPEEITGGDYNLFNINTTYVFPGDKYSLSLFARNVTNELFEFSRFSSQLVGTQRFLGWPRTFGVTFSGNF